MITVLVLRVTEVMLINSHLNSKFPINRQGSHYIIIFFPPISQNSLETKTTTIYYQ